MDAVPTLWRKVWAVLALVVALNFAYQVGPGHSDNLDQQGPAGQAGMVVADHHVGDGDTGHAGHLGGAHCAGHCGGHSANDNPLTVVAVAVTDASIRYRAPPDRIPNGGHPQPLIKPPSA